MKQLPMTAPLHNSIAPYVKLRDAGVRCYLGVDNVTNTKPPLGATGAGAGGGGGAQDRPGSANSTGAIYDVRRRQLFAGFRARF